MILRKSFYDIGMFVDVVKSNNHILPDSTRYGVIASKTPFLFFRFTDDEFECETVSLSKLSLPLEKDINYYLLCDLFSQSLYLYDADKQQLSDYATLVYDELGIHMPDFSSIQKLPWSIIPPYKECNIWHLFDIYYYLKSALHINESFDDIDLQHISFEYSLYEDDRFQLLQDINGNYWFFNKQCKIKDRLVLQRQSILQVEITIENRKTNLLEKETLLLPLSKYVVVVDDFKQLTIVSHTGATKQIDISKNFDLQQKLLQAFNDNLPNKEMTFDVKYNSFAFNLLQNIKKLTQPFIFVVDKTLIVIDKNFPVLDYNITQDTLQLKSKIFNKLNYERINISSYEKFVLGFVFYGDYHSFNEKYLLVYDTKTNQKDRITLTSHDIQHLREKLESLDSLSFTPTIPSITIRR